MLGFDFSESSERRGRSSWSWLDEEDERDRREEIDRDSASQELVRSGAFSELVEDDTVLRCRRFFRDLEVVEGEGLVGVVVW